MLTGMGAWTLYQNRRQETAQRDDEALLRRQLLTMRTAIKTFHARNGRYPASLQELVPTELPAVPADPFTGSSTTWRVTTEEVVSPSEDFTGTTPKNASYIVDVHSGAGLPYSGY